MWRGVILIYVVCYAVINVTTAPAFHNSFFIVNGTEPFVRESDSYLAGFYECSRREQFTLDIKVRGTHYTISDPQPHRKPYLEVRNATYHGAGPREEARAMCSVKTQEVNATANATITRRLHGVVTSRELHTAIQRLEVIIFGQMQQLWQSLDALRMQLGGNSHSQAFPDRRSIQFQFKPDMG